MVDDMWWQGCVAYLIQSKPQWWTLQIQEHYGWKAVLHLKTYHTLTGVQNKCFSLSIVNIIKWVIVIEYHLSFLNIGVLILKIVGTDLPSILTWQVIEVGSLSSVL